MKSLEQCLNQLENAFDELLTVAHKLANISQQTTSEADILPLQEQQENLLEQIAKADQYLHTHYRHELNHTMHEKIHAKLQKFQELNQQFINNLTTTRGLIQFDPHSTRKTVEEGEKIPNLPLAHLFTTDSLTLLSKKQNK